MKGLYNSINHVIFMLKLRILFILGVLVILVPLLGLYTGWKITILYILGALIVVLSSLAYKEIFGNTGAEKSGTFVDNLKNPKE